MRDSIDIDALQALYGTALEVYKGKPDDYVLLDVIVDDRSVSVLTLETLRAVPALLFELDELRRRAEQAEAALAAAAARVETLEALVAEQVRATINRDNIDGVVRCEWCDGEWVSISRSGKEEIEVHTETCWTVRARAALVPEEQSDG